MFKDMFKTEPELEQLPEKVEIVQVIQEEENDPEKSLIKNNIKIKTKFGTKFGTEFVLAKKYGEQDIKKALKGLKVTFDGNSIFVFK